MKAKKKSDVILNIIRLIMFLFIVMTITLVFLQKTLLDKQDETIKIYQNITNSYQSITTTCLNYWKDNMNKRFEVENAYHNITGEWYNYK